MSIFSPLPGSWVTDDWDALVTREVARQGDIEAAFDSADAFERRGQLGPALSWLDRAGHLGGGLSPACRAQRAGLIRALDRERKR